MKKKINKDLKCMIYSILINSVIVFSIPHVRKENHKEQRIKIGLLNTDSVNYKTKGSGKTTLKKKDENKDKIFHETKYKDSKNQLYVKKENKDDKKLTTEVKEPKKVEDNILATSQDSLEQVDNKQKEELGIDRVKNIFIDEESSKQKESVGIEYQEEKERNENLSIEKKDLTKQLEAVDGLGGKSDEDLGENRDSEGIKGEREKDGDNGIPFGYKFGVDKGIKAKWDQRNKNPKYPETAELRGMQGKIKLRLKVDKNGRVIDVVIEKGSGVPEINQVTEEVARTWIIKLIRNGMNVEGNVVVEYTFKLKGASN